MEGFPRMNAFAVSQAVGSFLEFSPWDCSCHISNRYCDRPSGNNFRTDGQKTFACKLPSPPAGQPAQPLCYAGLANRRPKKKSLEPHSRRETERRIGIF